jgi:hypothetical protein
MLETAIHLIGLGLAVIGIGAAIIISYFNQGK